jgi:hypothetical protein
MSIHNPTRGMFDRERYIGFCAGMVARHIGTKKLPPRAAYCAGTIIDAWYEGYCRGFERPTPMRPNRYRSLVQCYRDLSRPTAERRARA